PQRFPFRVGHDVVEESGCLSRVVQRQDVGVVEAGRGFDLAQKAVWTQGRRKLGLQNLDSDRAMVLEVCGEVDCRHPTAAELALDRVTVAKGGLQSGEQVHVRSRAGTRPSYGRWPRTARGRSQHFAPPRAFFPTIVPLRLPCRYVGLAANEPAQVGVTSDRFAPRLMEQGLRGFVPPRRERAERRPVREL